MKTTTVTTEYAHHKVIAGLTPEIRTAWIIDSEPINPRHLEITVACPLCGGLHRHGTEVDGDPGHRVAHCHAGSYTLRWAPDDVAQALLDDHLRCCAVTAAGTRCTHGTRRGWLCATHMDQLSRRLTIRFDYPTEEVLP